MYSNLCSCNLFRCHLLNNLNAYFLQDHGSDYTDEAGKIKHSNDNPFIEPVHGQTVVDMKGKGLLLKYISISFSDILNGIYTLLQM